MSIAAPGADLGCSGRGDRDNVLDILCPVDAALLGPEGRLGDERPDSGSAGELEPETEDLFVRRQSFLMLFTLISDDCLAAALPSSDASESTENRLDDGASVETLLSDLLCGACCRSAATFFMLGECSSLGGGVSSSEGKRPNGSGESGMTGESEPGLRNTDGGTSGGYRACSASSSRLRARLSSDMTSGPFVNRFWNGDFGSSVEMPLNAIRGGDGRPSAGSYSGSGSPDMLFRIAYGTAGHEAPAVGGLCITPQYRSHVV